jgi:hypothetical protein
MNENGWIKIHRSMLDKGWFVDSHAVHLWIYLLMKAVHKPKEHLWNGQIIMLQPGQFITGRIKVSQETGIQESKVERLLTLFTQLGQIEQQTTSTSRLISILNYDKYQEGEQRVNNKRTTAEQRANSGRTASEQPMNTKEELKNERIKELKKNKGDDPFSIIPDLWKPIMMEWHKYRITIKKKLPNIEKTFNELQKLSNSDLATAQEIVNKSIANGWQGLFELKKQPKKDGPKLTPTERGRQAREQAARELKTPIIIDATTDFFSIPPGVEDSKRTG